MLTGVVTLVVVVCLDTEAGATAVIGVVVSEVLVVVVPAVDAVVDEAPPAVEALPAATAVEVGEPLVFEPLAAVDLMGALKAMGLAVVPDEQAAAPVPNPSANAAMASLCPTPRREPI